jgi:3',5'-cyclic AMP phosphodiesterase CpdA
MNLKMFVLAHLSDPHLAPLPAPRLSELACKRALGFINWHRKRCRIHRPEVLDALWRDLRSQSPDHVAVTGDLVNIALAGEFAPARAWLERLGSPHDVTLVPGNHDAYVRSASPELARHWDDYMRGDEDSLAEGGTPRFPFVRRRGPIALIGLSSAVPTPPFMATGRLGSEQIARLPGVLAKLADEHLFRIVLIHHPPQSAPSNHFKRLVDAEAFRQAFVNAGAELVLHGHDHVHSLLWLDGPGGPIPALGVPSASAAPGGRHEPAAYNLYRIGNANGAWTCAAVSRGYRGANGRICELGRRELLGRHS